MAPSLLLPHAQPGRCWALTSFAEQDSVPDRLRKLKHSPLLGDDVSACLVCVSVCDDRYHSCAQTTTAASGGFYKSIRKTTRRFTKGFAHIWILNFVHSARPRLSPHYDTVCVCVCVCMPDRSSNHVCVSVCVSHITKLRSTFVKAPKLVVLSLVTAVRLNVCKVVRFARGSLTNGREGAASAHPLCTVPLELSSNNHLTLSSPHSNF